MKAVAWAALVWVVVLILGLGAGTIYMLFAKDRELAGEERVIEIGWDSALRVLRGFVPGTYVRRCMEYVIEQAELGAILSNRARVVVEEAAALEKLLDSEDEEGWRVAMLRVSEHAKAVLLEMGRLPGACG